MTEFHECCPGCGAVKAKRLKFCEQCDINERNQPKKENTMKRLIQVAMLAGLLLLPVLSEAKDLTWDRNAESDMQDYQVWACETPNCVVIKTQANLKATVPQTASGVVPKWTLPGTMLEGSLAVSARDKSLNESGLSVPVPFDQAAPAIPANPRLQ